MHATRTANVIGFIVAVWLAASPAALAQNVVEGTEELAFDRTESWAMKYFASLSILTSMGIPEPMGSGAIDLGFEGGVVPQLTEDQQRVGFDGAKLENLNRTRLFGRARAHIGLSDAWRLELAYLPPFDFGGVEPNLFAVGIGRPFALSDRVHLGARGYLQFGTIRGDITCGADEAAAGADPDRNPFDCRAPSNDELGQRTLGGEITAGYVNGRWRPYAGVAINYLDLELRVDAAYAEIVDRTRRFTDGTTLSATGGIHIVASERWRFTGEVFYTWLTVARPPERTEENDGLVNARFLVTYRIR